MQTPFFSIILPTHNRAALLSEAIASVTAQAFERWELIIIDDGSTDSTRQTVASFRDHRIHYFFQENQHKSQARNHGVKRANGVYICFLDDDDYYLPNHLLTLYQFLKKENFPRSGIIISGFIKRGSLLKKLPSFSRDLLFNYVWRHGPTPIFWCLHHIIAQDIKFDVRFKYSQDFHYLVRAFLKYPFLYLPSRTSVLREHAGRGNMPKGLSHCKEILRHRLAVLEDLRMNYEKELSHYLTEREWQLRICKDYLYAGNKAIRLGHKRWGLTQTWTGLKVGCSHKQKWQALKNILLSLTPTAVTK